MITNDVLDHDQSFISDAPCLPELDISKPGDSTGRGEDNGGRAAPAPKKTGNGAVCKTRLDRLFTLIGIMRSGHTYGPDDLARKLGVSRRTVFRDLDMLDRSGVPYLFDGNKGGYQLHNWNSLPPARLSLHEAVALYTAAKKIASPQTFPLFAEASNAVEKMAQALVPSVRDMCVGMASRVEVRWSAITDATTTSRIFQQLQSAAYECRRVLLEHDGHADARVMRSIVHPYVLAFLSHAWYVVGYSEEHGRVQAFNLDHILTVEPEKGFFRRPANFTLDTYLGRTWSFQSEGKVWPIRLRFSPQVADGIEEIIWHRTQQTERLPDGSLLFEAEVDGLHEISSWIMGYAGNVVVEEPVELRDYIQQMAKSILGRYPGQRPQPSQPRNSSLTQDAAAEAQSSTMAELDPVRVP